MARHYYSAIGTDTTLSAALAAVPGSGSIQVPEVAGDNGWPTTFPFFLAVDPGTLGEEIVEVTSKGLLSGANRIWAVNRAQNQTASHVAGATVRHVFTAADAEDAGSHVNDDGSSYAAHSLLPRGVLARSNTTTVRSTPASGAETQVNWLSNATPGGLVTVVSGRLYRVMFRGNVSRSDNVADVIQIRIRYGQNNVTGAQFYLDYYQLPASFVGAPVIGYFEFLGGASTTTAASTNVLPTVAAGPGTSFSLTITKNSGTANTATAGMSSILLTVEDHGAWAS